MKKKHFLYHGILSLIPKRIKSAIIYKYQEETNANIHSFSQEGEDMILSKILTNKGFYVDVGAYHPTKYSNTYRLYLKGWNGINIEPRKEVKNLFLKIRPRDISLDIGISNDPSSFSYYMFEKPEFNTFSIERAEFVKSKFQLEFDIKDIQTKKLVDVLDEHQAKFSKIDILNIDVEGYEMEVLLSNDWSKYKPSIILVEDNSKDILSENFFEKPIPKFLKQHGYALFAKTINTMFFKIG